jgi:hypothetical protein
MADVMDTPLSSNAWAADLLSKASRAFRFFTAKWSNGEFVICGVLAFTDPDRAWCLDGWCSDGVLRL